MTDIKSDDDKTSLEYDDDLDVLDDEQEAAQI